LPFFRKPKPNTHEGEVAIPTSLENIPAYTRVSRDHLLDPETGALHVFWMKPENVKPDMITVEDINKIIGRVVNHEKQANYAFRETDFLPPGTRPGMVAGIPPGKRSYTLEVTKIKGIQSLKAGDRFDLLATLPVDDKLSARLPENTQLVSTGNVIVPQKRATVRVIARNSIVVSPMTTRLVPTTSEGLITGTTRGTRPVTEVVFALDPQEITDLSEALNVNADIMCAARSGHPDDAKVTTETPELPPQPMQTVETIQGGRRHMAAFPIPQTRHQTAAPSQGVVPASGTTSPKDGGK